MELPSIKKHFCKCALFSRTLISINRQVKPNAEIYNVTVNNFLQFQLLRNANFISSFTFFVLPLSSDHFKKLQIDLAISLLHEPYQGQGHEKAYMIALPRYRPIQRALKYIHGDEDQGLENICYFYFLYTYMLTFRPTVMCILTPLLSICWTA